jgi:hypothetical protein
MLTTVAILIIGLGLMVSLARHVRSRSAEELTRRILVNLHSAMLEYTRQHGTPAIESFIDNKPTDEASLLNAAEANNKKVVAFFKMHKDLSAKALRDLPYDDGTVRDAWGTPIVFMPAMHRLIGMAPGNDWFFFSAGPDRQYLTRDDNQYSYEALGAESSRQ